MGAITSFTLILGRLWLALSCALACMPTAQAQDASSLKAREAALREQLENNPFQRPLYLESTEASGELEGDIYARIGQPYAVVGPAVQDMGHWCDILILHLNVKSCRATRAKGADVLRVRIGRKFEQPAAEAYPLEFRYRVVAAQPDYLKVTMSAEHGPLGTSDYRIALEVADLDAGHSFIHLSYSFAFGAMAGLATQGYLATIGRDKVGFSIVGSNAGGQPSYIRGTRGAVERNTMRYYLAVESYLGALSAPARLQPEKRLNDWFTATEEFPLQLHELERSEYLDMKRKEIQRQQAPAASPATP